MNKHEQALFETYNRSNARTLWDVYGTCSQSKRRAYDNICADCAEVNGYDMRVMSATSFFFSQAYKYDTVDPATGEVLDTRLRYYTGRNVYDFSIR